MDMRSVGPQAPHRVPRDVSWIVLGVAAMPIAAACMLPMVVPLHAPFFEPAMKALFAVAGMLLSIGGVLLLMRHAWIDMLVRLDAHPRQRGVFVLAIGMTFALGESISLVRPLPMNTVVIAVASIQGAGLLWLGGTRLLRRVRPHHT